MMRSITSQPSYVSPSTHIKIPQTLLEHSLSSSPGAHLTHVTTMHVHNKLQSAPNWLQHCGTCCCARTAAAAAADGLQNGRHNTAPKHTIACYCGWVWLQDHILQVQPGPLSMQLANTAAATAATPIQKQLTAAQGPSRSSERQPCRNAAKAYASVLRAQLGPS